ncbi:MAG TPA: restriction endonuclease subunit S [Methanocorpusculum sp.]|nr:restriction endonuclease subunit S [Methanocorpusculum sp.]
MGEAAGKGKERWPQVRLGDYIQQVRGVSYTPPDVSDTLKKGFVPLFRAHNIQDDGLNFEDLVYVNKKKISKTQMIQAGDILVCASSGSKNLVGKTAQAQIDYEMSFGAFCKVVRVCNDNLDPIFLGHYFKTPKYRQMISGLSSGANINNIRNEHVTNMKIPLPPLPEQRRIAAVLDQVSSLIALRKAQLAKLDLLVKARFVEMCDSTGETTSLSYYIRSLVAGKSLVGKTTSINKVLKTGAVTYDYFDATQIKNLPSEYEPQPEHLVRVNDVIISRMNTSELVGAAGYVWRVPNNIYLPDRLWRVEPMDHTNPLFLWHLLIQQSTKNSIKKIASGTSGSMKNISKSGLLGIKVKKVDLETQNNFAKFAKQTNKSKVEIQQGLIQLETLKKSLMQEYFG